MNYLTGKELNAAVREVLKPALADPKFRRLLLSDGKAAIVQVTNKPANPELSIQFIDNYGKSTKQS